MFTCSPIVTHFGTLRETVLLTPLLRLLHLRYGQRCQVIGSGSWLQPLLAGHPDVQALFPIAGLARPYWLDPGQRGLTRSLRAHLQGVAYVCDDDRRGRARRLLRRGGVHADQCRFADPDCPAQEGEHRIDRWQRFAAMTPPAFAALPEFPDRHAGIAPCLVVNDGDRADLAQWLAQRGMGNAPLVLLQPDADGSLAQPRASVADRGWPASKWVSLIQLLLAESDDYHLILCGTRLGSPALHRIAAGAPSPRVHLADDDLPLRRFMALCERAEGMLATDRNLVHVAAAMACPLLVLRGDQPAPRSDPRSRAHNSPVVMAGELPDHHGTDPLPVAAVVAAWRGLPRRREVSGHLPAP